MFEQNPLDRIEQIDAMRMGVDYRNTIKIRGFSIVVRPLAISESLDVAAKVVSELRKLPEAAQNQMTEHFILAKETLKLASTSDVGKGDIHITDMMLMAMTNDEVHYLFKEYVAACDKVNPALELMNREDLEKLIEELKQKKSEVNLEYQLTLLSFSQVMSLAHYFLTKGD